MDPVTIYVEREGSNSSAIDKDEQCLKTAVASYQILTKDQGYLGGNMVILRLRDFTYPVNYVNEEGVEVDPCHRDQEIDIAALATGSVLKRLKAVHCVDKNAVPFQARRGGKFNRDISYIAVDDEPGPLNFKGGIVTYVDANLSLRNICLFLGDNITPETLKKIDEALSKLFPGEKK